MARKPPKSRKPDDLVTVNAVANSSGRDRRTVLRRIALAGVVPEMVDGRTRLYRRADLDRILADDAAVPGTEGHAAACERRRSLLLKNDKLEFEINALKSRYITAEDHERWTAEGIAQARKVLLPGAALLAPQVVSLTIPQAQRLLDGWLHAALAKLAADPRGQCADSVAA